MKARFPEKYARIGSDKIMTTAIKSEVRKSALTRCRSRSTIRRDDKTRFSPTRSTTDSASDASGLSIF